MGRSKRRQRNRQQRKLSRESTPDSGQRAASAAAERKQADEAVDRAARAIPMAFLSLACLGVVAVLYSLRAYSLSMHAAAQQWPEVPCTIVRNGYDQASRSGRQGFAFEYEYTYEGHTYRSTELDLIPGEIGDENHYRRQLARERPEGTTSVCYVNPDDPASAVLDRDHMAALWVLHVLAAPFLMAGFGMGLGAAWPYLVAPDSSWGPVAALCRFFHPMEAHLVFGGMLLGSLFLCYIFDGFVHLGWLAYPATDRTAGVVVFAGRVPGNNHFLGEPQKQFEYTYEVDGRPYAGEGFAYWTDYKLDETVTVEYDSSAPERSYLTGTTPTWSPAALAWGMLGLVVLFGLIYASTLLVSAARVIRGDF